MFYACRYICEFFKRIDKTMYFVYQNSAILSLYNYYLGNCNVNVQNHSLLLLLGFMFDSQQHSFEVNRVIRKLHHKEHSTTVVKIFVFVTAI